MFIRRHIEIPSESRGCKRHTIDKSLSPQAFLSLVPDKVAYRLFSSQNLINLLQSYHRRLIVKKHLDFDQCMSLTDVDCVKLIGFTRTQHTQILSYILSTTRSAQSSLEYLLMKLKLGASKFGFDLNGRCG